jgi:hypothetical protein
MTINVGHRVGLPEAPRIFQMLIDGEWREAESGERIVRMSPAHDVAVSETPRGESLTQISR